MKPGVILLIAALASSCAKPPRFSLQGHFFLSAPNEAVALAENPRIMAAVEEIVTAIVNAEPDRILKYIDREKGAIIDAKAFVSYAQVASALTQPTAQLHKVLWNDAYWKETAPNDNIRSYQKIFSSAGEIRVGIFYYSAGECEVRLDFKNRPSMGIMGNPIFRKRDQRWYLVNFF